MTYELKFPQRGAFMKEEIKEILNSNKNKYIKFVAILYLFIGIIVLFFSICYALYEESILIFLSGLGTFLLSLFFYIMLSSFYETHQMCKFMVLNIYQKEVDRQEARDTDKRIQEQTNEKELNNLIKKLEK